MWRNLTGMSLSERTQTQNRAYSGIPVTRIDHEVKRKMQSMVTEVKTAVSRGWCGY